MRMSLRSAFAWSLVLLLVFPAGETLAQSGSVSGAVTNAETGEILPGVNLRLDEAEMGAATNTEGEYAITGVDAGEYTLVATYIGFERYEESIAVSPNEDVEVNIELTPDVEQLEAVEVTGYRAQAKTEATGSSDIVSSEELEGSIEAGAGEALQGEAAGVRVLSGSGQPGAGVQMRVRGGGSITAGERPLYIVDGVKLDNTGELSLGSSSPLAGISPSDIESIEVLKDAAATSIYGAQAANGVVLITTKQGREGETEINFSTQLGATERLGSFDVLNAEKYLNYRIDAIYNNYADEYNYNREAVKAEVLDDLLGMPPDTDLSTVETTDWEEAVYRRGFTQQYNLSISGGSEDTDFYVSGTFSDKDGHVIESNYKKGGLQANLTHSVTEAVDVTSKINLSAQRVRGTISGGSYINSPFWAAHQISPLEPIYDEDGSYHDLGGTYNVNPVEQEDYATRESSLNQLIGSLTVNYEILSGFFARTQASLRHTDTQEKDVDDPRLGLYTNEGGAIHAYTDRTTSVNLSQTFPFDTRIGDKHAISMLAGTEFYQETQSDVSAHGQGLPNFRFRTLASDANPTDAYSFETGYRTLSFFGEAEYTYDERYTGRVTARHDGSSRFGSNQRYGLFASVSGAWQVTNEAFMEDVDVVNQLRLRASYGTTGNSQIGNFAPRGLYSGGGEYSGDPGILPTSLANPSLTWEELHELNLGVDYRVFGNRLSGSVDAYRRIRDELLLSRDLPASSGFSGITENVGKTQQRGLEIVLSTVNVDAGRFQWDTDFNVTFQDTEVLELTEDDDETIVNGYYYRVGEPLQQYRRAHYAGVNPADGRPFYYDDDEELTYLTQDEDGELVGNNSADFFGGLENTFTFGGLSLNVFFQYDYGRTTWNASRYYHTAQDSDNAATYVMEDAWQEPGDITYVPKHFESGVVPFGSAYNQYSSTTRLQEDASYIRLKEVRLTYTLPSSFTEGHGLRNLTLYVQGNNLATFTNYMGQDPEDVGTSLGKYPRGRTFTGGVRVGL